MNLLVKLSYLTLFSATVFILVIFYWILFPYKTIEFKNSPFPVENQIVERGGRVRYVVDYCKYTDENPVVVKYFVDGVIYETAPTLGIMSKGCHIETVDVYIPRALPPGVLSVEIVAKFHPNPLRTITLESRTQQFTVK